MTLQPVTFSGTVPTPTKALRKQSSEVKRLTIGETGKNHTAMEPELQVFPIIFYVMLHLEPQRRRRQQREVCVLLVVVMLIVDVDVEYAGVSVDVTGREVEEKEEEGVTVEAVDVVVSATVWCLCECMWDKVW
ncbi:hypothetical protein NDU88_010143 [Pleurodeles waltl]|uniref:Uncharacterized protein n=1 Tax=Pleurodeles waltl TaxID=8319 RepID=A0AAV7QTL1_PLEWA|nr:hypothetical protein NDU88_010143 [Pleurodeles waltl]